MPPKKRVAVAAFAKAIKNPSKRRKFANDQITLQALLQEQDASLTLDDMPASVQQFVGGLSEPELALLANLQVALEDGALTETVGASFTLGKF
jgi:hypothetical protein